MTLSRLDRTSLLWPCLAVAALVILPFIGIQNLPLSDHPNHVARYYILDAYATSPALQSLYLIREGFQPYWTLRGFMLLFGPILGVEAAGHAFAAFALTLPALATVWLHRQVAGGSSLPAMLVVLVLFSGVAGWGFMNFIATLGIALGVFTLWIRFEPLADVKKLVPFALLALAVCTMHMIMAFILGLMIGFWELSRVVQRRRVERTDVVRFVTIGLVFLPALALLLLQSADAFGDTATAWGYWSHRGEAMMSLFDFVGSEDWPVNLHLLLVLGAVVALVVYGNLLRKRGIIASGASTVRIDRHLAFTAAAILIVGLALPFNVSGVAYLNIRFPLVSAILFIGAIRVDLPRFGAALGGVFALLLLAKSAMVHAQFRAFDADIRELRAAAEILPRGSKVFLALDESASTGRSFSQRPGFVHYNHQLSPLIIERDILSPYLFTMFEVGVRPEHERYTAPHDFAQEADSLRKGSEFRKYARKWREDFDYVVLAHLGTPTAAPIAGTERVHQGEWFQILKVLPDSHPSLGSPVVAFD